MSALKKLVPGRGVAPDSFLHELVQWGKIAPAEIFAPNPYRDIYSLLLPELGPYDGAIHRRAVMLEAMRVHAGFESTWNWKEGVDQSNPSSLAHIERAEAGPFQVSYDSTAKPGMKAFAQSKGLGSAYVFISRMKQDHLLAMEYYARLVRVSLNWAGPLKRHEDVPANVSRDAVEEFIILL